MNIQWKCTLKYCILPSTRIHNNHMLQYCYADVAQLARAFPS